MKLLLLHPQLHPDHGVVVSLQARGVAVLTATSPDEAFQMLQLHSGSVDAAWVHREGAMPASVDGLNFISRVRSDPALVDLPMVLSSEVWGDAEFAEHQSSPEGVNAYLPWIDVEAQLYSTICQVLGVVEESAALEVVSLPTLSNASGISIAAPPPELDMTSLNIVRGGPMALEAIKPETPSFNDSAKSGISLIVEMPQAQTPELTSDLATRILSANEVLSVASEAPELSISIPPADMAPVVDLASASQLMVEEPVVMEMPATSEVAPPAAPEEADAEKELPYLFGKSVARAEVMPVVVGDAVVPGGAAETPDLDTVKHYLELREKDVSALSIQLRETKAILKQVREELQISHSLMEEQASQLKAAERREEEFEREKALLIEGVQAELDQLKFELKAKNDKIRLLQAQVRASEQEMDRLKDRVRSDLRSIKSNEKKLENQLEMLKRDSETLMASRESMIRELKRKLDLTEFNLDLVQDKLVREREKGEELKGKLVRASQAVRVAGGLLDPPEPVVEESPSSGVVHGEPARKVS